jgi:biotin carboxylase
VIILPSATYRASEFLAAGRRLGVDVVTASDQPQALARIMGESFLLLRLDDPIAAADTIVTFATRNPVDAVLAVDDQGALAAAHAAERLGLVHNAPDAVAATRHKAEMRRRFSAHGVAQPQYRIVGADAAPVAGDVLDAAHDLGYPIVIKPIGLSGSRGVIRADDDVEAVAAFERVSRLLDTIVDEPRTLLVESFVAGPEFAIEGLLVGGELRLLAIFDKPDPLDGPYFEETIYTTPSRHDPSELAALTDAIASAAVAVGLSEGPLHGEARLAENGAVAVLEVAARTIGGKCAAALRFATGMSLEELVLRHALDDIPDEITPQDRASGVMMLPTASSGTLIGVTGREAALAVPGITGLEIAIPPGRSVVALPEGSRYLGFLFARGEDPAEVERALRNAHAHLTVEIDARERVGAGQ